MNKKQNYLTDKSKQNCLDNIIVKQKKNKKKYILGNILSDIQSIHLQLLRIIWRLVLSLFLGFKNNGIIKAL